LSNQIQLTSNHSFVTGEKVTLKGFAYNKVDMGGQYYYVKVIDVNIVELYYDAALTRVINTANVTFNASAQIIPVQYTPSVIYSQPKLFSIDGRGILSRLRITSIVTAIGTGTSITTSNLASYLPGNTDLTISVPSGVQVSAGATGNYALSIGTFDAADTVFLVNAGFIVGQGGAGGTGRNGASGNPGSPGGSAMNINNNIRLHNSGQISGGGGGGGAGGGSSGQQSYFDPTLSIYFFQIFYTQGGNGGSGAGPGGATGGGQGFSGIGGPPGGAGGSGGSLGNAGNGGGSSGGNSGGSGGAAGKGINLNGKTITYSLVGTINGAVS